MALSVEEVFPGTTYDDDTGIISIPIASLSTFRSMEATEISNNCGELIRAFVERYYDFYTAKTPAAPKNTVITRGTRQAVPDSDDWLVTYQMIFRLRAAEYNVVPES